MRIYVLSGKKFMSLLAVLAGIILVLICTNFIFSSKMLQVFSSKSSQVPIYSVAIEDKKVAITFDCAWGASDIASILDSLKKENVKATFFLVGQWMQKYPDQVKVIAADGHEIGNHSDTHPHMVQLTAEKMKQEIIDANEKIERLTGKKCTLFRAPYGDYNEKVIRTARGENQYTIQWDVDSLDWKDLSSEAICERVMKKVKNGSIILMHNDTKHTAKALPVLLKSLKNKGYDIVPVSQLIFKDNYYIDHEGKQHMKETRN